MDDAYVLAADVGGTNLRIAAVSVDGELLHQVSEPTPRDGEAFDIADSIRLAAESCIAGSGRRGRPMSFGLALAALVNPIQGKVLSSPNLPQLNEIPLSATLSERLGITVALENDATAAAIGEYWLGASKGVSNSVLVTLGTGVGGGLILDGRPYRGADGTAGEVGHICVEPEGHPCGCGSRGCVEQYSSATAIVRIAGELITPNSPSALQDNRDFDSKDVYAAAMAGDPIAVGAFQIMGRYLGIALADLVDVLNPELIVIGGGAAGAWDFFSHHVRSEIQARAFRHPADRVQLVRASLGGSAGIFGAARIAIDSVPHQPVHRTIA